MKPVTTNYASITGNNIKKNRNNNRIIKRSNITNNKRISITNIEINKHKDFDSITSFITLPHFKKRNIKEYKVEDFIKHFYKRTNDNIPTKTYSIFSNQFSYSLSGDYEMKYNSLNAITRSTTRKKKIKTISTFSKTT